MPPAALGNLHRDVPDEVAVCPTEGVVEDGHCREAVAAAEAEVVVPVEVIGGFLMDLLAQAQDLEGFLVLGVFVEAAKAPELEVIIRCFEEVIVNEQADLSR